MKRSRFNKLQIRLTALVLAVTIPPLVALALFASVQAGEQLEQNAQERLQKNTEALANTITGWMDMNVRALEQLVSLPGIIAMNAAEQKPILEAMAATYPHMYLVSTTGLGGINVARNDDEEPKDYHDRTWYQSAAAGTPLTFQTLIGRTSGQPALVASTPIRDKTAGIVGVGMFATNLSVIADQVHVTRIGETGFAYLVNAQGQVLAHPDPTLSAELTDLSAYAPVARVLEGYTGLLDFTDQDGTHWKAYVQTLDHNWGLILQQQTGETLSSLHLFQRLLWFGLALAAITILILTWMATRRALRPVGPMTEVAMAVAQGDLNRTVPVESDDELGILAQAFNAMIGRLNASITSLEARVAERTANLEATTADLSVRSAELEEANERQREINRQLAETVRQSQRRATLLQANAEVSRAVSQIRDLDQLLPQVTQLISQHFGFYHAGILLIDEAGRYAVLQAASSEGGQRMLAAGHKLAVGTQGIVGHVTGTGQPRVALNVGEDAVYFDNPHLPDTRSEMALPLRIGATIIGALDVQSTQENAFDAEDVNVLTALADQIAIAIRNAQLFEHSQAAIEEAQRLHRRFVQQEWSQFTQEQSTRVHEYTLSGVRAAGDGRLPAVEEAWRKGELVIVDPVRAGDSHKDNLNGDTTLAALAAPIKVRDEIIGFLGLQETDQARNWTEDEIALIRAVADQLGQALEGARLFEQTQTSLAETRTLFETSRSLAAAQEMEEIWQVVIDAAQQRRANACALLLFDTLERKTARDLIVAAGWEQGQDSPQMKVGARMALHSFADFESLRPNQHFCISDLTQARDLDQGTQLMMHELGFTAVLHQPAAVRNRWFGLLTILYRSPHHFTTSEIDFYRTLADQAALAIEGKRLLDETQRRAEREQTIRQITDKVHATPDVQTILQTTVQELGKALGLPRVFVKLGTEKAKTPPPGVSGNG